MIVKSDTPQREELTEPDTVRSSTLQPHLPRGVVSVHRGLECANPVDADVRRHLHLGAIDGNAQIDDSGVLTAADGLRL